MEWPTDATSLIRALLVLGSSGGAAWLFRRFPRRLGRWFSKRVHLERENVVLLSENNSLKWENKLLTAEIAEVHRRVEDNRKRAERIDLLLGSEGLAETTRQPLRSMPDASSPPPTTT
jgi:hypothetical protein